MSFLMGGTPPVPRAPPVAPDTSGQQSQDAMEAARRRAAMATGREKLLLVPQDQTQAPRQSQQKMLLGA